MKHTDNIDRNGVNGDTHTHTHTHTHTKHSEKDNTRKG